MATWYNDTVVLDGLLDVIRQGSTQVWLIEAYTQGDSYAIVPGNVVADADSAIGIGDFSTSTTAPGGSGFDREMDFLGAAGTASATSTLHDTNEGLHIALTNGVDTIYAVTDETSNQPIVIGNPVTFPSFTLRTLQPTQI